MPYGRSMADKVVTVKAYAKINLALDVLGKRNDGYHEVVMIMQTIDLADTLELLNGQDAAITVTADDAALACDRTNLACRAAALLRDSCAIRRGIHIHLRKRIPVAAGLAGGSADAAGVLTGLNHLWQLGLTVDQLAQLGSQLGSDVPFCLKGGTMLAEGRGERLTRLPALPACPVVLVKPPVGVSTAWVYGNYRPEKQAAHPDIGGMRRCLDGGDLAGVAGKLGNVLESVTMKAYPEIGKLKKRLKEYGCIAALMSGSGPTVFGLTGTTEQAQAVAARLQDNSGMYIATVKTVSKVGEAIGTEIVAD